MTLLLAGLSLVLGYGIFAAVRLGFHRRLPLALGRISLEEIPDRAARMYGDTVLFTSDRPCAWEVPALRGSLSIRSSGARSGFGPRRVTSRPCFERGSRLAGASALRS